MDDEPGIAGFAAHAGPGLALDPGPPNETTATGNAEDIDRGADDAPFPPEESSPGPGGAGPVPATGHAPRPPPGPEARRDQAGGRSGRGADGGGGPQVLPPGRPRQLRRRPLTRDRPPRRAPITTYGSLNSRRIPPHMAPRTRTNRTPSQPFPVISPGTAGRWGRRGRGGGMAADGWRHGDCRGDRFGGRVERNRGGR